MAIEGTVHLRTLRPGERVSATMALRFICRAGRYILQQQIKVKYRIPDGQRSIGEWRDVELVKEGEQ